MDEGKEEEEEDKKMLVKKPIENLLGIHPRRKSDMLGTISSKGMSEGSSLENNSGFRRREQSQGSFVESSNQNSDINRLSSSQR